MNTYRLKPPSSVHLPMGIEIYNGNQRVVVHLCLCIPV